MLIRLFLVIARKRTSHFVCNWNEISVPLGDEDDAIEWASRRVVKAEGRVDRWPREEEQEAAKKSLAEQANETKLSAPTQALPTPSSGRCQAKISARGCGLIIDIHHVINNTTTSHLPPAL